MRSPRKNENLCSCQGHLGGRGRVTGDGFGYILKDHGMITVKISLSQQERPLKEWLQVQASKPAGGQHCSHCSCWEQHPEALQFTGLLCTEPCLLRLLAGLSFRRHPHPVLPGRWRTEGRGGLLGSSGCHPQGTRGTSPRNQDLPLCSSWA